jgi:AbrB family looped-hinge helix DNA binding protein
MDTEIIKMSAKGQLVVPRDIRESLGLKPADRFISVPIEDGIMFKKVKMPDFSKELKELTKLGKKKAKSMGFKSEKEIMKSLK